MPVEPQTSRATPPALGPYSPAVRVGPWLILSGQLGLDPETGTLVDGGAEAQTARAMKTISAVLAEHDLSVIRSLPIPTAAGSVPLSSVAERYLQLLQEYVNEYQREAGE